MSNIFSSSSLVGVWSRWWMVGLTESKCFFSFQIEKLPRLLSSETQHCNDLVLVSQKLGLVLIADWRGARRQSTIVAPEKNARLDFHTRTHTHTHWHTYTNIHVRAQTHRSHIHTFLTTKKRKLILCELLYATWNGKSSKLQRHLLGACMPRQPCSSKRPSAKTTT